MKRRRIISPQALLLLLPLLLLTGAPLPVEAQRYPHRRYTMREGLPDNQILCLLKDSRGLLWIGTGGGLCSFDGLTIRIYSRSEMMTTAPITSIAEDDHGTLWFGTYGEGLYRYDGRSFRQQVITNDTGNGIITALCWSERHRCLVMAGTERITVLSTDSTGVSKRETIPSLPVIDAGTPLPGPVTCMIDAGNFLYVTLNNESNPCRFYPATRQLIPAANNTTTGLAGSQTVYLSSAGDTILSNGNRGIISHRNGRSLTIGDTIGRVTAITEDFLGNIWIAAAPDPPAGISGGIYRYRRGELINFAATLELEAEIKTLLFDQEQHILWIGSNRNGLTKAPFSGFYHYDPEYFGLDRNPVNAVFADHHQRLWISGSYELIIINPDKTFHTLDRKTIRQTCCRDKNPGECEPAEFGQVTSDGNDGYFIGCGAGLIHYREATNQFRHLNIESRNRHLLHFNDTLIVTGAKTAIYTPAHTLINGDEAANASAAEQVEAFNSLQEPRDVTGAVRYHNRCWFTSHSSGLWMSRGEELLSLNASDTAISKNLTAICTTPDGLLIFGSHSGEISIADYRNNQVKVLKSIGPAHGIKGNSIRWLAAGNDGMLWAGTNQALNSIDLTELLETGRIVVAIYDNGEGYTGFEATQAVIDPNGILTLGTEEYLIGINTPFLMKYRPKTGRIILQGVEINHQKPTGNLLNNLDPWTLLPQEPLVLSHRDKNITFNVGINNHLNPRKDQYRFRLEGERMEQSEWNNSGRIVLNHLTPGSYRLTVESFNLNTLARAKPLSLAFTIKHPWWGYWYVQSLMILALILTALLTIHHYIKHEKQKQWQRHLTEKKILQLEMQALQAQMNPHFIFNCLTGIQYLMLTNKNDEALAFLADFSRIVRGSLENVTRRLVPLDKAMEFLKSYLRLEQMRFPDKFTCKIIMPPELLNGSFMVPPMVVQPFVENAIRHGFMNMKRKGELSVLFERIDTDVLQCTITDNGIGRAHATGPDQETAIDRPHSIAITQARINHFNTPGQPAKYRISFTDLNGDRLPANTGLKVEIRMPLEFSSETKIR